MSLLRPVLTAVALIALPIAAPASRADDGSSDENAPSHHHLRVAAMAGAGSAFGQTYFLFGARLGYELALGLELDLEGQWWTGASPGLGKIAPGLIWYAPLPLIRPYVGAFYAHWFVGSGLGDQDALGWRAGLQVASAGPASVDIGFAYERLLSCAANCDSWWPEATASVRF